MTAMEGETYSQLTAHSWPKSISYHSLFTHIIDGWLAEEDVSVDADGRDAPEGTHAAHEAHGADDMTQRRVIQEPLVPDKHAQDAERIHEAWSRAWVQIRLL
jgi:hypothetical protein